MPDKQESGDPAARPSRRSESRVDRIEAICPGCQATLHVRRNYIGNDVICKRCKQVFQVPAPSETQALPERAEPDPRQHALEAEHAQLNVAHNLLQADHDRLNTENSELRESLQCVTTELESIRAALGTIAPEHVGSLANERQTLAEEVDRLRDELRALLITRAERDQLVAERQQWGSERDLAHAGRDLVVQQLRERDDQLQAARGELEHLKVERQTAVTELDQLRIALARIDEVPQRESERLDTEQVASDEVAAVDEESRSAVPTPREEDAELLALRAQVKELGQRLDESEQIHREMAAVLAGMGINCRPIRV